MAKTKIDMQLPVPQKKPQPQAPVRAIQNLQQFTNMLNQRALDSELRKKVMEIARKYPEGSLNYMYANIEQIIAKCQQSMVDKQIIEIPVEMPVAAVPEPPKKKEEKPPLEQRKPLFGD